jgi:hypothetical protein
MACSRVKYILLCKVLHVPAYSQSMISHTLGLWWNTTHYYVNLYVVVFRWKFVGKIGGDARGCCLINSLVDIHMAAVAVWPRWFDLHQISCDCLPVPDLQKHLCYSVRCCMPGYGCTEVSIRIYDYGASRSPRIFCLLSEYTASDPRRQQSWYHRERLGPQFPTDGHTALEMRLGWKWWLTVFVQKTPWHLPCVVRVTSLQKLTSGDVNGDKSGKLAASLLELTRFLCWRGRSSLSALWKARDLRSLLLRALGHSVCMLKYDLLLW